MQGMTIIKKMRINLLRSATLCHLKTPKVARLFAHSRGTDAVDAMKVDHRDTDCTDQEDVVTRRPEHV